jgi:hypothetical protein
MKDAIAEAVRETRRQVEQEFDHDVAMYPIMYMKLRRSMATGSSGGSRSR